jgi:hypothetical protein
LQDKLLQRIRPFVDAKNPGDHNDHETKVFEARIKTEAEDLKLESFGVEVSYLIILRKEKLTSSYYIPSLKFTLRKLETLSSPKSSLVVDSSVYSKKREVWSRKVGD